MLAAAVYGAAASLGGINSQGLGADDAAVLSCDSDGVAVSYSTGYTSNALRVMSVSVTGLHDNCVGRTLVALLTQGGVELVTGLATVTAEFPNNNRAEVNTLPSFPRVEDVDDVHVEVVGF